jgi:arthrofactin-type cyclic lipopeptide synthetase C
MYVVDERRRPVPIGVNGEICIGGDGVAMGYIGRPELTAERFVADPFSSTPGARMYRTGDIGRVRSDGHFECLGRTDHQVKVRGFRIELGEVEAALAQVPGVTAAAVVVQRDAAGDNALAAFISGSAATQEVRAALARRLPDYMIPSRVVTLERLPLGASAKIDRRALASMTMAAAPGRVTTPPRDEIERAIVDAWSEILEVSSIGIEDDFFDLGGHSLKATRARFRLERDLGVALTLVDLFRHSTVSALADRVRELRLAPSDAPGPVVAPLSAAELELLGE